MKRTFRDKSVLPNLPTLLFISSFIVLFAIDNVNFTISIIPFNFRLIGRHGICTYPIFVHIILEYPIENFAVRQL